MSGRTLTWLRGVLLGGAIVFTTALTGCLVQPVDEGDDDAEAIATAESELNADEAAIDVPDEPADGVGNHDEGQGPDPLPWIGRPSGPDDPWLNTTNNVASPRSAP